MKTKLRILIVEDSEDDAYLMLHQIRKGGYDVDFERVETAVEMTHALKKKTWDIVLSDYQMPHFNGMEALKILKKLNIDIPFIIVSGRIGEEFAVSLMKQGAHDYIMKNNLKRLLTVIERELREAHIRTEKKLLEVKKKQAEEALNKSEERYRLLFRNMNAGVSYHKIITDKQNKPVNSKFLDINPAFEKLIGLKKKDILNKPILKVMPRLEKKWIEKFGKVALTGNSTTFIFFSKDLGKYIETKTYSPKKGYFAATFSDVTKRILSDQIVKESEEQLSAIFDGTPVILILIDKDLRIVKTNKTGIEQINKKNIEILGLKSGEAFNCINALNNPKGCGYSAGCESCGIRKSIIDTLQTKSNHFKVETHLHQEKDGKISEKTVLVSTTLLKREIGEFILVAIDDITEKKKAEKELRESEIRYRTLYENANDSILVIENNRFIGCNPKALSLFKCKRDQLVNHTIAEFSPEFQSDGKKSQEKINSLIELSLSGVPQHFEWEHMRVDKSVFPAEVSLNSFNVENEQFILAIIRDITERKNKQKETIKAVVLAEEIERSRIARDLHDGVSPVLSAVKLLSQSMVNCKDEELQKQFVIKIEESVKKAILSLSEISNKISPHILLNFGVTEAVQSYINKVSTSKKIKFNLRSNLDKRLNKNLEIILYRAVIELINNSIKHANATEINILLSGKQDILLNYSDNGKGFNYEEIIEKKKGMGLFNLITRIESVDGNCFIDSKPGKGMIVEISIPGYE